MHEGLPEQPIEEEKERAKREIIALARELAENKEGFSFPGLEPEAYTKLKGYEAEFPGFATPIDELVERFKKEGMKIVLGPDPESGNVFILPSQSDDIENDSISPKYLIVDGAIDDKLKNLILLKRE